MSKSPSPKKETVAATYEIGAELIEDVFHGMVEDEAVNNQVSREWFNLCNNEKITLEHHRDDIQARKQRRRERREKKRKEEEERRLYEKRNNPENLAMCASQIQKYFRARPVRAKYLRLQESLSNRKKRRALVIIVDQYEDKRVRPPVLLQKDTFELLRNLQAWNFSVDVYCCASKNEKFRPTRANIVAALQEVSQCDSDTMLWVHVCGNGGTASVNGKNPFHQAQRDQIQQKTPRTRLIHALQSSHARRNAAGGTVVGDLCHFVFPTDAKSTRLTFDNIVTFDEILDILNKRHSEEIFGRPLHQRIVTIDVAPFGFVEGLQGGGCAVLATSATPQYIFELSAGSAEHLVEPFRSVLTSTLNDCFRGQSWKMEAKDFPVLNVSSMVSFVDSAFNSLGLHAEKKGKGWGDFPVVCGDRVTTVMSLMEKVYAQTQIPLPGAEEVVTSVSGVRRKKKGPSYLRQSNIRVTMHINVTKLDGRMDVWSTDYATVLSQYLHVLSQAEPNAPVHRHQKLVFGRLAPNPKLIIGINGTIVEVQSKCKTKGLEGNMWAELIETLTEKTYEGETGPTLRCGKGEEGGAALIIPIPSEEFYKGILSRLDKIPQVLNGFTHHSLIVEQQVELTGSVAAAERLLSVARGKTVPMSKLPNVKHELILTEATATSIDLKDALGSTTTANFSQSISANFQSSGKEGGAGSNISYYAYDFDAATLESFLDACLANTTIRTPRYILEFARQNLMKIYDVEPTIGRLNEVDDACMDAMMRLERPMGAPVSYVHTGMVVCVVAMAGAAEARLRQIDELYKVSSTYEAFFGIRFLLWEAGEQQRSDPKDITKERITKILNALKSHISTTLPALLMLDFFKKRYYRYHLQGATMIHAPQIFKFCDDLVKGALAELLPPVKGSRIYGAGVSKTKYALIPI